MPLTSVGSCRNVHVNSCRSTACKCILKLNYIFKRTFACLGNSRDPSGGFGTNKATTLKLWSVTCALLRMSFWCACLLSAFSVTWTENNPASLDASETPTGPWHPWARNIQRSVVTLPLCKVGKTEALTCQASYCSPATNSSSSVPPIYTAWITTLPQPLGKFYSFR